MLQGPGRYVAVRTQRALIAVIAALCTVVATLAMPTNTAFAHDWLVSSNPGDGERLESAPSEMKMTFSGVIMDLGTELALINITAEEFIDIDNEVALDNGLMTLALPPLEVGAYAMNWRVVSEDGHPVSGTIHFAVGTDVITEFELPGVAGEAETASNGSDGAIVPLIVSGLIALVVVGAVVAIVVRTRRGMSAEEEDSAALDESDRVDAH